MVGIQVILSNDVRHDVRNRVIDRVMNGVI